MFSRYIDVEAKRNASMVDDIDMYRDRYADYSYSQGLTVLFPGFDINTISRNIYSLYTNSVKVPFKINWSMRPDYVSYEYYKTVTYWWLILYINNIDSILEFIGLDKVIIPSLDSIQQLIRDRVPRTYIEDKQASNYSDRTSYYRRYPMDLIEAGTIYARSLLDITYNPDVPQCVVKEITETFILTSTDISNAYVDLSYDPINYSSLKFYIDDYINPQSFSYDYMLIYVPQTTHMKRISWSEDDCTLGDGLESILESGDSIKVTYAYQEVECSTCEQDSDVADGGTYS